MVELDMVDVAGFRQNIQRSEIFERLAHSSPHLISPPALQVDHVSPPLRSLSPTPFPPPDRSSARGSSSLAASPPSVPHPRREVEETSEAEPVPPELRRLRRPHDCSLVSVTSVRVVLPPMSDHYVCSPCDDHNNAVPVVDLLAYNEGHAFADEITCFCVATRKRNTPRPVRLFVPMTGEHEGDVCLGCPHWRPGGRSGCRYFGMS